MTEAEWLACTDPKPMLKYLWGKVSDRKFRLFRCACCRRFGAELSASPALQRAVELGESYADGLITKEVFQASREDCNSDHALCKAVSFAVWPTAHDPAQENRMACARLAWQVVLPWFREQQEKTVQILQAESAVHSSLLRDIFGNPFSPVSISPTILDWHVGLLVSMAWQMYDSRDFTDMPILADALEEAGCTDQNILGHCRSRGEHVRGCWVVDLVLGKS